MDTENSETIEQKKLRLEVRKLEEEIAKQKYPLKNPANWVPFATLLGTSFALIWAISTNWFGLQNNLLKLQKGNLESDIKAYKEEKKGIEDSLSKLTKNIATIQKEQQNTEKIALNLNQINDSLKIEITKNAKKQKEYRHIVQEVAQQAKIYTQVNALKIKILLTTDNAIDNYSLHEKEINEVLSQVQQLFTDKEMLTGPIGAEMRNLYLNPENHLLGGFFERWREKGKLDATFILREHQILAIGFDQIAELIYAKINEKRLPINSLPR